MQLSQIPERYPVNATFELTVRCNLKCKMCLFRHCDSENPKLLKNELSAKEWIGFAKECADMGVGGILLTGGEPLLREDFAEIYESIYRTGFIINLYTNATLITPQIMDLFRKYPPHKIGISIYGASPETYEKVCGNKKAFSKMLEGVRNLLTLPSVIDFRTTIIKDNLCDAEKIDKLIKEEFNINQVTTQTRMVMKGVRGACSDTESCRLSPEENVKLALKRSIDTLKSKIGEAFDEKNIHIYRKALTDNNPCSLPSQRLSLLGCSGGMTSFALTWDGKLQACQILGAFYTDAKASGLKNAWDTFQQEVTLPPVNLECKNCEKSELCQCCYASRYAETGSLEGCPEYACLDAKIMSTYYTEK